MRKEDKFKQEKEIAPLPSVKEKGKTFEEKINSLLSLEKEISQFEKEKAEKISLTQKKKKVSPSLTEGGQEAKEDKKRKIGSVNDEVKRLKILSPEEQVKELCELVFEKGLVFSVEVAKKLNNDYVLDKFHDTLVDELKPKLIEQGELEN